MSLSERLKSRRTPEPLPGLSRSRSFAGLLAGNQHRRTASATANFASLGSGSSDAGSVSSLGSSGSGDIHHHHRTCNGSSAGGSISASNTLSRATNILGQSHSPNTTRRLLQGFSATWGGKPPPAPRPQRAVTIFQAIEKGLRECIRLTQKDITNLRSSVDSLSVNSSQQLKTAERYLKRLEYQAAKLEELSEQYDVQQRMRDGVRTMAYAYVLNPGRERDSALHNVRSGYKECTDILCGIETELERMMGTLMFQIKEIQGFARLCAGDVFEITVKHGEQKWKTKGRILKNEKQIWDNPRAVFKALMGEMLYIKAVEVRTLSKNILLGHKYCETKDLFSAHPQMMTVNLNPSGSLKLHVVITWNPLHGCPEELSPKPMPPLLAALQSPMMKRRAPLTPNSTIAVVEDLHSPSSNDPLPNGRNMVCIIPPSPSISRTPQLAATLPRSLRQVDDRTEDSLSVLDFLEENENFSCHLNVSQILGKGCMQRCHQTGEENDISLLALVQEDLNNCMFKNEVCKDEEQISFQEGHDGVVDIVRDLHVNFSKVHDDISLYGSRGGYQSSGYESQSRNGSTWRSVHFSFDKDCDQSSFGSAQSQRSLSSPMLCSQAKRSCVLGLTDECRSMKAIPDTGVRRDYIVKGACSCSLVKIQPYSDLNNVSYSDAAQHRLDCYLEYR